jgi:hypothetical protein
VASRSAALLVVAAATALLCGQLAAQSGAAVRRIGWDDLGPFREQYAARGLTSSTFADYVNRMRAANARRVREGDLDHLVFYLLQSTRLTSRPPIEPALSAKALVEGLSPADRTTFLKDHAAVTVAIPRVVSERIESLLSALAQPRDDVRLGYFRELVESALPAGRERVRALEREYLRVMRFVYEKEFVAQRAEAPAAAIAELYRTRGLSTDTAVEAGYVVDLGLGVVRALDPNRRIRRALIVGPGLDLAPRTGLREVGSPESYQPWAVADALVSLGLSRLDDLTVVAADVNPRVVAHLRAARARPPVLTFLTDVRETPAVTFTAEYREYFARLGQGIAAGGDGVNPIVADGRLRKSVTVSRAAAAVLHAEPVDILTDRLTGEPFDLVIATNILPYIADGNLPLAVSNIAAMTAPGGIFLHNEARPLLGTLTDAAALRFEQSRHATIATVAGAPPLFDSIWIHRKR